MKVLIVKISSMGDLIQLLPAITDATRAIPGIQFDWVAEEAFMEIPTWHPSIARIIPIAHRRWKKNIIKNICNGEIKRFYRQLREKKYDYVIDAQSNHKSALVTMLSKGNKYGVCARSVREKGADFAYDHKITIPKNQNHVIRMRQLFAKVLRYKIPLTDIDYGIDRTRLPEVKCDLPERFIFLTHIASRRHKLWPEEYWRKLIEKIVAEKLHVVLPWWSAKEKQRAQRLAALSPNVQLIPPMNISEKAAVMAKARAAISCDTGLAHIAAALNIPNIIFYGPTNPALVGTIGRNQVYLEASSPDCAPCLRSKCQLPSAQKIDRFPACLASIKPGQVFAELKKLI